MIKKALRNTIKYNQIVAVTLAILVHILLCFLVLKSFKISRPEVSFVALDISVINSSDTQKHHDKNSKLVSNEAKFSEKNIENTHHHAAAEEDSNSSVPNKITPQFNPLPQIPQDLRVEAFQSEAIARFYIDGAGNVEKVELVKPCANPRLNSLLLKSLRQWKFSPSNKSSTQDINVKFRVQ